MKIRFEPTAIVHSHVVPYAFFLQWNTKYLIVFVHRFFDPADFQSAFKISTFVFKTTFERRVDE